MCHCSFIDASLNAWAPTGAASSDALALCLLCCSGPLRVRPRACVCLVMKLYNHPTQGQRCWPDRAGLGQGVARICVCMPTVQQQPPFLAGCVWPSCLCSCLVVVWWDQTIIAFLLCAWRFVQCSFFLPSLHPSLLKPCTPRCLQLVPSLAWLTLTGGVGGSGSSSKVCLYVSSCLVLAACAAVHLPTYPPTYLPTFPLTCLR